MLTFFVDESSPELTLETPTVFLRSPCRFYFFFRDLAPGIWLSFLSVYRGLSSSKGMKVVFSIVKQKSITKATKDIVPWIM